MLNTSVEDRLRAILLEMKASGLPLPDRTVWRRRYPANEELVLRLFDEIEGRCEAPPQREESSHSAPTEVTAEVADAPIVATVPEAPSEAPALEAPTPAPDGAHADSGSVPPAEAAPTAAAGPTLVRTDPHGQLFDEGENWLYRIPAERLTGRSPAVLYLQRARAVAEVKLSASGMVEVTDHPDGSVIVRFSKPKGRPLALGLRRTDRRGATRRILHHVARLAETLERLHDQGGAHGRLGAWHVRIDPRTQRLHLSFGFDDGPGLDDGDVARGTLSDLRAIGALLYGSLCLEGQEPCVDEILDRSDHGELPSLATRRPDLLPALVRTIDRAVNSSRIPGGFADLAAFLSALVRTLDLELDEPASPHDSRRRVPTAAIGVACILLVVAVVAALASWLPSSGGPLEPPPPPLPPGGEIRQLIDLGRPEDASLRLLELGRQLGLK